MADPIFDDIIKAVLHPFATEQVAMPEAGARIVVLNALPSNLWDEWRGLAPIFVQSFRPFAQALMNKGFIVVPHLQDVEPADYVLMCGRKQQVENRALLAQAAQALRTGGMFVCAAENDNGGRRLAKDCEALGLSLASDAKYHCRIHFGQVRKYDLIQSNIWIGAGDFVTLDIADQKTVTRPGLFSWDRLDLGSALLCEILPADLKGSGADLGCGYGVLSRTLLAKAPKIKSIYACDAEYYAVQASLQNLKDERVTVEWRDVMKEKLPVSSLDWVVMNPPFHQATQQSIQAGLAFIQTASQILHKGGHLWMVANAHLPYEAALKEKFYKVEKITETQGFKIYKAVL
jgi:16S rRNA (guanine1207-N2)-methyltransferase